MSHTSEISLDISDLDCLAQAASDLGLEFVRGQTSFKAYYGTSREKCHHAIRIPNDSSAYEVGVAETGRPGRFRLLTDFFAGGKGMVDKIGQNGEKLKQAYTTRFAVKSWQKKGYRVKTTTDAQGFVTVEARRRT